MAWTNQRTDIKTDEFYRIIYQKGYWVIWEQSSICPCVQKGGQGQPDFNCPLCLGKGRYYFNPKTIQGIMTNFNAQDRWTHTGEIMSGTSYFTTFPQYKLGFWDRITMMNSTIRYSQVIVKGDHNGKDRLKYTPTDVLNVRTVTDVYTKNIDFTFDPKLSYIDWSLGSLEPDTGIQYSIEFVTHPRWIVIDLITVVRDTLVKTKRPGITYVPLPVRGMIKLEFFIT